MCGILSYISNKNLLIKDNDFKNNLKLLNHRGPDNLGTKEYNTENHRILFGHTRLSIIDLSINANQPSQYNSKGILIYNGEIYNHIEIRKKYLNKFLINFKSNSDTETLYYLCQYYKFEEFLNFIEGMYSFLFYDKNKNTISVARDIAGEKPLYIHSSKNLIGFSSDLKPFKKLNKIQLSISKESVSKYFQLNYIPAPFTIYNECFKLPPASFLEISLNQLNDHYFRTFDELINNKAIIYNNYWEVSQRSSKYSNLSYKDTKLKIKDNLIKSVNRQLISDVPLGSFLSSGIDSSLVTAIAADKYTNLRTFTVGYEDNDLDESLAAKKIANYLGTIHSEYIINTKDVIDMIPKINKYYSEPFSDSSQIPTLIISKFASSNVKAVLSGDGGDELFCGYNRYIMASKFNKINKFFPKQLKFLYKIIKKFPLSFFNYFYPNLFENLNNYEKKIKIEKILDKFSNINSNLDYYLSMKNQWSQYNYIYENDNILKIFNLADVLFEDKMMLADFITYLPDDILCKVDRATMAFSLESRSPFLSKKVIESAMDVPLKYKLNNHQSKFILRDILNDFIPNEYFKNKKMGFAIPINELLINNLNEWTQYYLSDEVLNKHNFFNKKIIKDMKEEHFKGYYNHEHKIWNILNFNNWYEENYQ